MKVKIIDQLGWLASFITKAKAGHEGDTRKSSGMLLAMPLQCTENVSKRVLDVRYSRHRCVARFEWCTKLMSAGGTCAVLEAPVDVMSQWASRFYDSRSQALALCRLKLLDVNVNWRQPASVWVYRGKGSCLSNMSERELDMLWCAYVRGKCREMGMPDDMSGTPPEDFVKKLLNQATNPVVPSEVTWDVACKSLCNVQTDTGRKYTLELLGPSETPVEVGMLCSVGYGLCALKRATVGLARKSDLVSGDFDFGAYEQGLTRQQFLFRQPGVLDEKFQWYRLDKIWSEEQCRKDTDPMHGRSASNAGDGTTMEFRLCCT